MMLEKGVRYLYTDEEGTVDGVYVGLEDGKYKFLPDGFPPFFVEIGNTEQLEAMAS